MIALSGLRFAYPGQDEILSGLDLKVAEGSLLVLVGANGTGKSTLLSLLAGLLTPTGGSLEAAGAVSPGQEADLRARCGLLLQDADLQILGATVGEDLRLGLDRRNPAAQDAARTMAQRLTLDALMDRPVQALSWGQKRRLCLAAVLLRAPRVLLFDEPMTGLDYPGIREMRALLKENKAAGLTQVVAAHDLEPLADICDALAVLHGGTVALHGPPEAVLSRMAGFDVRPPCSWRSSGTITPWEGDG